jgi:uncharacterized protein (DUF1684 family)
VADYREELLTERAMKDRFMAHHAESPFVGGRVYGFSGLQYFPPDPRFRLSAMLERPAAPAEAYLRTNRDGQATMRYLGDLVFRVGRETLRLRVYHAGEGGGTSVFVPFRDLTSGKESYSAGRYLTLELNETDRYDLDFNRAFNPYCAYTESFECPLPPVENDLPVAIRAGERTWIPPGSAEESATRAGGLPAAGRSARARPARAVRRSRGPPSTATARRSAKVGAGVRAAGKPRSRRSR